MAIATFILSGAHPPVRISIPDLLAGYPHSLQASLCATCASIAATLDAPADEATAPSPRQLAETPLSPLASDLLDHVLKELHKFEKLVRSWPGIAPAVEEACCAPLHDALAALNTWARAWIRVDVDD